jgi:hypothetical protein
VDVSKTLFVIPCGATKLTQPSPARTLYTGAMFRYCLAVIEEEVELARAAGRHVAVRILSARHGLLDLDTHVEPYDQKMTDRDAVPTTIVADQLIPLTEAGGVDIHAFLPRPYLAKLLAAHEMLERRSHHPQVHDHYLGARGIGHHRQVLATLRPTRGADDPHAPWRRPVSDRAADCDQVQIRK